ncbi:hypothetical protein DJ522_00610 [Sulfolobus sp. F3]|nr:hypothetical protein DJ522_00610 [Sulfolobus sp. F3]
MKRNVLISTEISHDNCWTEITQKYDVKIKLIDQNFLNDRWFSSTILIIGKDSKSFISSMRKFSKLKISKIEKISDLGYLLEFLYGKDNAVSKLLKKHDAIVIEHKINDGLERWKFIIQEGNLGTLKEELDKRGEIRKLYSMRFEELGLSQRNIQILRDAYKLGYFDTPRKISIYELSEALGIKPNTLIYHIRRVEKSILKAFLDDQFDIF